eukprot:evm.model.scf_536.4 EVM.evm.TU.scf_536.4   scf_536:68551-69853(+)
MLLEGDLLAKLVDVFSYVEMEHKAQLCGALFRLSGDPEVAPAMLKSGVIRAVAGLARLAAKEMGGKGKKGNVSLPEFLSKAVAGATGVLRNLILDDEVKAEVGRLDVIQPLASLLKAKNPKILENVGRILWNAALEPRNKEQLAQGSVPTYIVQPLPET